MAKLTDRILKRALGSSDIRLEARRRTMRGLRDSDDRQLYIGLALAALSYLRRTAPRRQLVYRRELREDAALVIYHKSSTDPRLEIVRRK
ncbi:MAG: hypothetical protein L0Z49_03885 [Actinobacteria bacterium]|nr:hypothetical protein [Actinomycetota bacterium]MCI0543573.1 hypothetical protein [Actinomycetota bacterium]MCI0677509.1 hypothetical protein [Actinomycetota bacterium]